MAKAQHKVGSGFGATTTPAEVLRGIDLTRRLGLVTGGYSGIGLETTRALRDAGGTVVVPARRPSAARAALADLAPDGDRIQLDELDLADQNSVRGFAERFLTTGRAIDILICGAGVMALPERRLVGPGWERQFATNHLGHFALVNRLWPAIAAGRGRVVSVSSAGHRYSGIRWDDPTFARRYDKWQAYGQSKTANILFAVHLDRLVDSEIQDAGAGCRHAGVGRDVTATRRARRSVSGGL